MMYIMPLKWTICWTKLWSFETPWRSCNVTLVDQKGIQISEQPLDQGQRPKSSQGMIITKILHTCQQESWSSNDSVAPVENRPVRWVFVGAKQCHYRLQDINKRFLADLKHSSHTWYNFELWTNRSISCNRYISNIVHWKIFTVRIIIHCIFPKC